MRFFSAVSPRSVALILILIFVQHVVDYVQGFLQSLVLSNHALVAIPSGRNPISKGLLQLGLAYLDPVDQLLKHCSS